VDIRWGSVMRGLQTTVENAGVETREWTTRHEMTRVDKAGVDNAGVETRDRLI